MQPLKVGPRAGLVEADVREALSYQRGGQVRHGVDVLDRQGNLLPGERLRVLGGQIAYGYRPPDLLAGQQAEVAAVRRTGGLTVVAGPVLTSRRLRVWTEHRLRTGAWARWHLGVMVVVQDVPTDNGVLVERQLDLADKSRIWADVTLTEPLFLPPETVAVDWVKADLTARFGETRFAIAGSAATVGEDGLLFEADTPLLQVYTSVLRTVGLDQLTVTEDGAPASQLLATVANRGPEITYAAGQGKVLAAGSVVPLLPTLPNVVRFSARQGTQAGNEDGNGLAYRRNRSTGPASLDARGYPVEVRVDVEAYDQPTLEAIADADAQRYLAGGGLSWSGQVALNPGHSDRDVIALGLPRLRIEQGPAWNVTGWTYPLDPIEDPRSVLMPITAERRVL